MMGGFLAHAIVAPHISFLKLSVKDRQEGCYALSKRGTG
jgi:hypothetical protein